MHPIYSIYALETFPYGILYFTNKSNKNLVGSRLSFATVFVSAKMVRYDTRNVDQLFVAEV